MRKNSAVLPALVFTLSLMNVSIVRSQSNASAWGSIFVNGPYKNRWGLHVDAQVRSNEQMDQLKTWLFRPGLQYQLNTRNTVTLGYAYVHGILKSPGLRGYSPEHRVWQQWLYVQPIRRYQLQHRFRVEQRFLGATRYQEGVGIPNTSIYSTRFRYFNRVVLPITGRRPFEKGLFAALQNELFLHVSGKNKLNGNTFDQNRFYLAAGYRPAAKWDVELGYMRRDVRTALNTVHQQTWQLAVYLRP
jgi:hypothetical protein